MHTYKTNTPPNTAIEIAEIEMTIRDQSKCELGHKHHKVKQSNSHFGAVRTRVVPMVSTIMYSKIPGNRVTNHGLAI